MDGMPPSEHRLQMRSKAEAVADVLRDEIRRGVLEPGTMLRQRDIADRYGVSPTPVREALSRLQAEGFVSASLHRGATVVRRPGDRLRENSMIRATLEALAVEIAAPRLTDGNLAELQAINQEMARGKNATPRMVELNRAFHMTLYEATDLPLLMNMLRQLWHTLEGGPRVDRSLAESVRQHEEILEALRAKDGDRAAELTRAHILTAVPLLEGDKPA